MTTDFGRGRANFGRCLFEKASRGWAESNMGNWGTALYSDDLAADLRGDFRDLIGQGMLPDAAFDRLVSEYESSLQDTEEAPVFWLAVAHAAWRLGRPIARATAEALRIIDSGSDLVRWSDPKARQKRQAVLNSVAKDLRSQAPAAKRVPKPFVADNCWSTGELVAYRLDSGAWTLFRVIGHHVDKGGRSAVCEPLDWVGTTLPDAQTMACLPLRRALEAWQSSQFMLAEPRRKQDAARLLRTGVNSSPVQHLGGYGGFVFPYVDIQLFKVFGVQ